MCASATDTAAPLIIGLLREHRTVTVKLAGRSMVPRLQPGDEIIIAPVLCPISISIGEIAVFTKGHVIVAHRVIWIPKRAAGTHALICRSDNGRIYEYVRSSSLLGHVTLVRRSGQVLSADSWRGLRWALDAMVRLPLSLAIHTPRHCC